MLGWVKKKAQNFFVKIFVENNLVKKNFDQKNTRVTITYLLEKMRIRLSSV